jgi:hypothetical protein
VRGIISTRRSPIRLKIREFLKARIGAGAAETLVQVNGWLQLIQAEKTHNRAKRTRMHRHLVEQIAEDLTAKASGIERRLLSQSLQEAMYYATRIEANITHEDFNSRLSLYLHRWGEGSFLRRFLSLFFFNFIRFHTAESLRGLAETTAEFEAQLEELELVCQRTVAIVWKSHEKTKNPLDLGTASQLLSEIEKRLTTGA